MSWEVMRSTDDPGRPFALVRLADGDSDHDPHSSTNPEGLPALSAWQRCDGLTEADVLHLAQRFAAAARLVRERQARRAAREAGPAEAVEEREAGRVSQGNQW